jgi:hypothetical protein
MSFPFLKNEKFKIWTKVNEDVWPVLKGWTKMSFPFLKNEKFKIWTKVNEDVWPVLCGLNVNVFPIFKKWKIQNLDKSQWGYVTCPVGLIEKKCLFPCSKICKKKSTFGQDCDKNLYSSFQITVFISVGLKTKQCRSICATKST